jgi:hypothetical protein
MDIIEALQQDIRRAREAYRLERTARATWARAKKRAPLTYLSPKMSQPRFPARRSAFAVSRPGSLAIPSRR